MSSVNQQQNQLIETYLQNEIVNLTAYIKTLEEKRKQELYDLYSWEFQKLTRRIENLKK